MYWPMLLWQQYLFSGDEALLRTMAPRLTHFLDWIKAYQDPTTKLLNPPTAALEVAIGSRTMPAATCPAAYYNIATACQYYENLRIASRVFSVLGQTNQSNDYLRQAEEVKAGINSNLFNGEFYLARTDRKEMFPLASAWALRFGIEPAAVKSKVLATIEKRGETGHRRLRRRRVLQRAVECGRRRFCGARSGPLSSHAGGEQGQLGKL